MAHLQTFCLAPPDFAGEPKEFFVRFIEIPYRFLGGHVGTAPTAVMVN